MTDLFEVNLPCASTTAERNLSYRRKESVTVHPVGFYVDQRNFAAFFENHQQDPVVQWILEWAGKVHSWEASQETKDNERLVAVKARTSERLLKAAEARKQEEEKKQMATVSSPMKP